MPPWPIRETSVYAPMVTPSSRASIGCGGAESRKPSADSLRCSSSSPATSAADSGSSARSVARHGFALLRRQFEQAIQVPTGTQPTGAIHYTHCPLESFNT
jgi:hypothetical protein